MCKFYTTLFACFCETDFTIIEPCTCSQERYDEALCDIFQPANEPIVLRDLCAICALLGCANNVVPEKVYERYHELCELEDLQSMVLTIGDGCDDEQAVVLKDGVFESMMELKECLPHVGAGDQEQGGDQDTEEVNSGQDMAHELSSAEGGGVAQGELVEEVVVPVPTFFASLVDRTKS